MGFTPHRKAEGKYVRRTSDIYRLVNKRGKDKRTEDKKFYEKNLDVSVDVTTGYRFTEITINLDLS